MDASAEVAYGEARIIEANISRGFCIAEDVMTRATLFVHKRLLPEGLLFSKGVRGWRFMYLAELDSSKRLRAVQVRQINVRRSR